MKKKNKYGLTDTQCNKIVGIISGTSGVSYNCVCEDFKISMEDLEEIMLDAGYERCEECDWWCECFELVNAEGEPKPCDSCEPLKDEDDEDD